MLRDISEFCPPGMQIKSPGGFSFDPAEVVGIEAHGHYRNDRRLIIHLKSGRAVEITFYENSIGGDPPDHYVLKQNIDRASKEIP